MPAPTAESRRVINIRKFCEARNDTVFIERKDFDATKVPEELRNDEY
jgi:hypothetical protein